MSITEWKPFRGAMYPTSAAEWQKEYDLYVASPEFLKQRSGPVPTPIACVPPATPPLASMPSHLSLVPRVPPISAWMTAPSPLPQQPPPTLRNSPMATDLFGSHVGQCSSMSGPIWSDGLSSFVALPVLPNHLGLAWSANIGTWSGPRLSFENDPGFVG